MKVHVGLTDGGFRFKFTDDIDCLPADILENTTFETVKYSDVIDTAMMLERLGFSVCVDMGSLFYDTNQEDRSR